MRFFIKFLNNFSVVELLEMFAEGAFKSTDEIKMVDYTINYKIVFDNEYVEDNNLKIYEHLQRVVELVRKNYSDVDRGRELETKFRCFSTDIFDFNYFIKCGENEREVKQLNIIERRIIFTFKRKHESMTVLRWLKNALGELITYALKEFEESDRVGIVIKHESQRDRKATFPIHLKTELEAAIILDTLTNVIKINGCFAAEERMTLQVVRIKPPGPSKQIRPEYLTKFNYNE
ncbi:uncharacterized protein LOC114332809 [Diabrotica virgifera virgifera]|uniref:Uncharacterized protein LOC114332809 n=1 Tax=Diabrotica virgifera virgifera TaxID=50390 RepID=A0A6P7FQ83_DIAVI|nr:uncharacterized protein LOC114332809 [Diabrotica virgifera virgifera]